MVVRSDVLVSSVTQGHHGITMTSGPLPKATWPAGRALRQAKEIMTQDLSEREVLTIDSKGGCWEVLIKTILKPVCFLKNHNKNLVQLSNKRELVIFSCGCSRNSS